MGKRVTRSKSIGKKAGRSQGSAKKSPRSKIETSKSRERVRTQTCSDGHNRDELDLVLKVLSRITRDLGARVEPNTSLLLYTLLQTPSIVAHRILGALDPALRARLLIESWESGQDRHFGVSSEHIKHAAGRIARDVCGESEINSRHLLMVCLVGSGFLANLPELRVGSTESKHILGRSNLAVRAIAEAGLNPIDFLERLRAPGSETTSVPALFPSFFVFWQQPGRTRVLRIEEVGEFVHRPGTTLSYPATLGLLDGSLGKRLETLMEFEDLINEVRTPESAFQRFFEVNPSFLLTDEHLAARPGILLESPEGFGLKPDFFLQRRDSPLWDIAELKLPSEQLVRGRPARRGLAAAVGRALDQLRRYREYFLDSNLKDEFRNQYGLEVYYPRLTVIIGRDDAFGDYHERQRLTPPEARLLTYDDLLRLARHRSLVLPFVEDPKNS